MNMGQVKSDLKSFRKCKIQGNRLARSKKEPFQMKKIRTVYSRIYHFALFRLKLE